MGSIAAEPGNSLFLTPESIQGLDAGGGPIMKKLFDLAADEYGPRAEELQIHGVAVWDVLQACTRSR